ncbi:MTH1187 family thiamine-binding protein [Thermodesulfobacterium thermophilum]|uniref:MTH1187 family thiamine-binding protein n=1 Tax=Thermodesulfobacterium thermophilum TaxID=886 RepID=UPI00040A4E54|nr:MTH1187 family thiamine-binding protein [Thermodesulfobacterium thermophilum]
MAISIFPVDKGESLSSFVARAVKTIKEYNYPYVVTPMETVVETESIEEALKLAEECFKALEVDCNRIIVNIKIDYRKGKSGRIKGKVESVQKKINEPLSTV